MDQYFAKQPKVINGVPQKLYFMREDYSGVDHETGGSKFRISVMSILESELGEFAKTHGTEAMAVFKIKE